MRKYTTRTIQEKMDIVSDYFKSGLSIRAYAEKHYIPPTTLQQWINKVPVIKDDASLQANNFYNVTESIKNQNIVESKGVVDERYIPKTNIEHQNEKSLSNVTMKLINGIEIQFDVDCLEKILRMLS